MRIEEQEKLIHILKELNSMLNHCCMNACVPEISTVCDIYIEVKLNTERSLQIVRKDANKQSIQVEHLRAMWINKR